jgi:hypothetical protein
MATRMKSFRMIESPFPVHTMRRGPTLHCDRNHEILDLAHKPKGGPGPITVGFTIDPASARFRPAAPHDAATSGWSA